jgi:hypothetical protein
MLPYGVRTFLWKNLPVHQRSPAIALSLTWFEENRTGDYTEELDSERAAVTYPAFRTNKK